MKLAVLGTGTIGARHLAAAEEVDNLDAVAIVELNEQRAAEMVKRYGVRAYTDIGEMLTKEKPSITVVSLPHFLHKAAAIQCAEAGSHIMLEKPMALSLAECDEIMEASERNGVQLLVGHTPHYKAENRAVKQIIESGELGSLVMINDVRHQNFYRDNRPAWFFEKSKSGGGIMTTIGAHSIDKIQWFAGGNITKVKAMLSFRGERGDIEASGLVLLETAAGVAASISQSGYPGGVSRNETEFIFTKGMLKTTAKEGLLISRDGAYVEVPVEQTVKPFALQFRDLMDAIQHNKQPACPGSYSRTIVSVLESIYRSSELGTEQWVEPSGKIAIGKRMSP